MDFAQYIPMIISAIGALVVLVNIIVEVLKKVTNDKIHANILAVGISLILSLVALFALCAIMEIPVMWYYVAATIVLGFMVAYAAMFGFDKLKQIIMDVAEKNPPEK